MKIFVINKKSMLIIGSCILATVLAITIGFNTTQAAVTASNNDREIPIYNVDTTEKKVSLSFDAAWGNEQTTTLLNILDEYNINATFFLVGAWVDKYPDSVKEIVEHGNEIGNHSNTHPHMSQISQSNQTGEIASCNSKVEALTGTKPVLFRAPYGEYNNDIINAATSESMYTIQWNIDSLDWKDPTPQQMVDRITKKLEPGSIILMHNGATNTPEALPMIIQTIQNEGYEIVPISQLIYKDNYTIDNAGKQISQQS